MVKFTNDHVSTFLSHTHSQEFVLGTVLDLSNVSWGSNREGADVVACVEGFPFPTGEGSGRMTVPLPQKMF